MTYNLEREIKIDVDETRREGYEKYLEVNVHEEIKQQMMTVKCFLNNLPQKLTVLMYKTTTVVQGQSYNQRSQVI